MINITKQYVTIFESYFFFHFRKQYWKYETRMHDVKNILTFGIYGRIFNLDHFVSNVQDNVDSESVPVALGGSSKKQNEEL